MISSAAPLNVNRDRDDSTRAGAGPRPTGGRGPRGRAPGTFESLVEQHQDWLHRLAVRMCRGREEANDIVQDTLLDAYRGFRFFRAESTFKTWLYRIARNVYLMRRRSERRRPTVSLDQIVDLDAARMAGAEVEAPSTDELVERRQLVARALKLLEAFDTRTRLSFLLRDVGGVPVSQAANLLHISTLAVRHRAYRARRGLRRSLQPVASSISVQPGAGHLTPLAAI